METYPTKEILESRIDNLMKELENLLETLWRKYPDTVPL